MNETEKIAKSSLKFLAGTLLSRFSGLFRDIAMAVAFGASAELAAFMVAFRFSNLLRRLLGESSLSACFIPEFERVRGEGEEGARFFRDFFLSLLVVLIAVVTLSLLALGLIKPFLTASSQIVSLTQLMLPGLIFIALYALTSSLLQCERRYFLSGAAPIAFNLVWAAGALLLANSPKPFIGLAWVVVLAYAAQFAATLPATLAWMRGQCVPLLRGGRLFPPLVRRMIKPFFLAITGMGAVQINSFFDSLFGRFAAQEGPAYLWYAIRLQQLPLALFGIALSSALLPPLARAIKSGDHVGGEQLLTYSLNRAFALLLPASLGLMLFGEGIVSLLFGYGHFKGGAVIETARSLMGYSWGLVPAGWTLLLAPLFYSRGDYQTPLRGTLISVGANIALNALLVLGFHCGAESVAHATSLSALINFGYLMMCWRGRLEWRGLFVIALCTLAASLASSFGPLPVQLITFCLTYFGLAYAFSIGEILDLFKVLLRK